MTYWHDAPAFTPLVFLVYKLRFGTVVLNLYSPYSWVVLHVGNRSSWDYFLFDCSFGSRHLHFILLHKPAAVSQTTSVNLYHSQTKNASNMSTRHILTVPGQYVSKYKCYHAMLVSAKAWPRHIHQVRMSKDSQESRLLSRSPRKRLFC